MVKGFIEVTLTTKTKRETLDFVVSFNIANIEKVVGDGSGGTRIYQTSERGYLVVNESYEEVLKKIAAAVI